MAENHEVGIEVTSLLNQFDSPEFAIGYYGSLSDALSPNIVTDPGLNNGTDLAARVELVWQMY